MCIHEHVHTPPTRLSLSLSLALSNSQLDPSRALIDLSVLELEQWIIQVHKCSLLKELHKWCYGKAGLSFIIYVRIFYFAFLRLTRSVICVGFKYCTFQSKVSTLVYRGVSRCCVHLWTNDASPSTPLLKRTLFHCNRHCSSLRFATGAWGVWLQLWPTVYQVINLQSSDLGLVVLFEIIRGGGAGLRSVCEYRPGVWNSYELNLLFQSFIRVCYLRECYRVNKQPWTVMPQIHNGLRNPLLNIHFRIKRQGQRKQFGSTKSP